MAEGIAALEDIIAKEVEKSTSVPPLTPTVSSQMKTMKEDQPSPVVQLHEQTWDKLLIKLVVNNQSVIGLYDSGAQCSLLSQHDAQSLQLGPSFDRSFPVRDAGGNIIPQKGIQHLKVTTGEKTITHPFVIVDGETPVVSIFGLDLITALNLNLIIDPKTKEKRIYVGDIRSPVEIIEPESTNIFNLYQNLSLIKTVEIPPNETCFIPCSIAKNFASLSPEPLTIYAQSLPDGDWPVLIQEQLVDVSAPIIQLEVSNPTPNALVLPLGAEVATFDCAITTSLTNIQYVFLHDRTGKQISAVSLSPQDVQNAYADFLPDCHEAPGFDHAGVKTSFDFTTYIRTQTHIPREIQDDLLATIPPGLVSKHEFDIGKLNRNIKMDIKTHPTCTGITQKPYPLNPVHTQQLEYGMAELARHGIFTKEDSNWVSPAFVIKRAPNFVGGPHRLRIVTDYRKLNAVTIKDNWPLPQIPKVLEKLREYRYYCKIDISQAFLNCELTPEASMKAAVITENAIWRPNRVNFGLTSAPNFFAKVIHSVVDGLDQTTHFQDDLICMGKDIPDCYQALKQTLFRLHEWGLKINGKMDLFREEVTFLGRTVNAEGIRPLPKHVTALRDFPTPTSVRDVQTFLGLIAWLMNFIPNYATLIEPLCAVLRNKKNFFWESAQESAFQALKASVTERTINCHSRPDLPIYVAHDASDTTMAAFAYNVIAYDKHDIAALAKIHLDPDAIPPSSVPTSHPILPHPGKGIPNPVPLQANEWDNLPHIHAPKFVESDDFQIFQAQQELPSRLMPKTLDDLVPQPNVIYVVRPLGYYSYAWKGAEQRYSILEKEALGALKAVEAFKDIILACKREVYLITDSSALLFSLFLRKSETKYQRWLIRLLAYEFKLIVAHIPGKFMVPDHLTRLYAVPPVKPTKNQIHRAQLIVSPFRPGQILTKDDLIRYVEQHPEVLHIPPHEITPRKSKLDQMLELGDVIPFNEPAVHKVVQEVAPAVAELQDELSLDKIISAQKEDTRFGPIYKTLLDGHAFPPYVLDKYILKRDDKIVLPDTLLPFVLALHHYTQHVGHQVLARMIRANYYSPRLEAKALQMTNACHLCKVYTAHHGRKNPLGRDPFILEKGRQWSMDKIEGLPPSYGFDSILTIADRYSHFLIALPVTKQMSAQKCADLFEVHVLGHFQHLGAVHVRSDEAKQLVISKPFQQLAKDYGFQAYAHTPHSAKSHGYIEQMQRRLSELLRILSEQYNRPWNKMLVHTCNALNAKKLKVLGGFSPAELLYGTTSLPPISIDELRLRSYPEEVDWMNTIRHEAHKVAKEADDLAIQGLRNSKYLPRGSLIYIRNFGIAPNAKWKHKFVSTPFEVVKDYGLVVLAKNFDGLVKKVHKDNIRPCPIRAKEQFDKLPLSIKKGLGFGFTPEEIRAAIAQKETPTFWRNTEDPFEGPLTRARTKQLAAQELIDQQKVILPEIHEDDFGAPREVLSDAAQTRLEQILSEDDTDDENDLEISVPRRVRFNI